MVVAKLLAMVLPKLLAMVVLATPLPFFSFLTLLLLSLSSFASPHTLPPQHNSTLLSHLHSRLLPIHQPHTNYSSQQKPTSLHTNLLTSPVLSDESITDTLQRYGLPIGLIPAHAVESFSLSSDGGFQIRLARTCYAKFDYKVYYAKKVTGRISYGAISDLSGIEAKELFIWVSVTGIHVDNPSSGYIYFEIGIITKKLSLALFDEVPDCKSGVRTALE